MKKLIFLFIFFASFIISLQGTFEERLFQVQFNFGIDVKGCHDRFFNKISEENETVLLGYSPSIEIVNQGKYFDIGVGCEYQLEREIENTNGAKFNFIPIYSVWRLTIIPTKTRELEAIAHFGYNFFNFNEQYLSGNYTSTGNLYWGAGLSLVLGKRVVMQTLYKENRATVDYLSNNNQIKNTHITLSLGLRI